MLHLYRYLITGAGKEEMHARLSDAQAGNLHLVDMFRQHRSDDPQF